MNQKEELEKPDDAVYTNGEICLDNGKHMAYKNGQEIHLTPMEYNLLYLFMRNPGKVLTYHTILQKIWNRFPSSSFAIPSPSSLTVTCALSGE